MGIPKFCYHVYQEVKEKGLIREGDRVILGLSGGADSVCLFLCLFYIRELLPFSLSALHVIHGIRGEEAEEDAEFVKELAARFKVPISIVRVDAPAFAREKKLSLEEAARDLRLLALKKAAEEEAALIALAQHMEDQAETVLFQLIRGSSIRGLSGMRPCHDGIIRPLLSFHKQEILDFLKQQDQDYRTDSTNADENYARNAIRHRIMPELLKLNGGAVEHLSRLAKEMGLVQEVIGGPEKAAYEKAVIKEEKKRILRIGELMSCPELIQRNVVYQALSEVSMGKRDLTEAHVRDILDLFRSEGGKRIALPCGVSARKKGKTVILQADGFCDMIQK